ncbi:hypothetical protein JTE90_012861 [Oedothorax gibbosus]|uniref:DNA-directed RNA polymerases I and III subunit RPAC1 n=1 Tax=Oedothorax gibbosus TaxID=931172 RepID=A0AAV6UMJ7_9ARAC|nr:hypothetical protein JTE90_012861 [Oedothorax gibbosus]
MPADEKVYKLKEFCVYNEAPSEACYGAKPLTVKDLIKGFKIQVTNIERLNIPDGQVLDEDVLEFDMMGVGPPIANAIRRILIAEVKTMAIDKIHLFNNTTVIPDEVLTHRIGLIPIKVDPRLFNIKATDDDEGTEEDTLQFDLKVKCTRTGASKSDFLPDSKAFNHSKVYSSDLKFVPIGNQKQMYGYIRPVKEDILIAVMKPGHEIDLRAFCYKNKGREHAKFSPVVIASYKLLPELRLHDKITGDDAKTLAKCFPKGVIEIVKENGQKVAKIANPRLINCSRNVFLHEELKDRVEICKVKDHYLFTVESAGALSPEELVTEAINILKEKCQSFLNELKSL